MPYDLTKIAARLINKELTLDQLRSHKQPRGLQISAAVVIFAFNGKFRFLTGKSEGSYHASLTELYPDVPSVVLVHQSSERKLHKEVSGGYRCVEITPPSNFWGFIAKFDNIPPAILVAAEGINLKNPKLGECVQAVATAKNPVVLAQQVFDESLGRSILLGASGDPIKASYFAVLVACIVWYCRDFFLHEETYSHFSLTKIYQALFGLPFAAQHGNSIRSASLAIDLHRTYSRTVIFQPPVALKALIEEHPRVIPFITDFVMAAKPDIERARMDFGAALPQASNTQRARLLASMINQYERPVIMEALSMLRNGA